MTSAAYLPVPLSGTALATEAASPVEALSIAWLLGYASPRTRTAYARDLRDYLAWCAGHELDPLRVRRGHLDAYARELTERGQARSTLARRLAALSSFYGYAVAEDVLERNPVAHVRRPKVSQDASTTAGLTRAEARALLAAAAAHSPRSRALITLLLDNGLRIGETLAADVSDLGTVRGHRTLTVTRKGDTRATVPLSPRALDALETYLAGRTDGPVFTTRTGGRLDAPAAFRLVRRLAETAELPNAARISPHSLRHTFGTTAREAGVPLEDVQDAMGHADPRTTRRYDRNRHSLDRHATYTVAAYLADGAA